MKITKIIEGRQVVFTVPSSPAKPTGQQYSAPPAAKPSPFAAIGRLLGFKRAAKTARTQCTDCGTSLQLNAAQHAFWRGEKPVCETCAGGAGVQLAQCYATVAQNPAQQYTAETGSVSVVQ